MLSSSVLLLMSPLQSKTVPSSLVLSDVFLSTNLQELPILCQLNEETLSGGSVCRRGKPRAEENWAPWASVQRDKGMANWVSDHQGMDQEVQGFDNWEPKFKLTGPPWGAVRKFFSFHLFSSACPLTCYELVAINVWFSFHSNSQEILSWHLLSDFPMTDSRCPQMFLGISHIV